MLVHFKIYIHVLLLKNTENTCYNRKWEWLIYTDENEPICSIIRTRCVILTKRLELFSQHSSTQHGRHHLVIHTLILKYPPSQHVLILILCFLVEHTPCRLETASPSKAADMESVLSDPRVTPSPFECLCSRWFFNSSHIIVSIANSTTPTESS